MDDDEDAHFDAPIDFQGEEDSFLGAPQTGISDKKRQRAKCALICAVIFTAIFMLTELIGGYFANSLAIMADAAHLLTDVGAMGLSLFVMHLAQRPPSIQSSFGFHRAEILGALASILTIWTLVGILVYSAVLRLISDIKENTGHGDGTAEGVDGKLMTIIGCCGLGVNIINAIILGLGNSDPHLIDDDADHQKDKDENINVRSAFIHVIGDCLQSLGVIVASLIVWLGNKYAYHASVKVPSWYNIADPIASLLFGVITIFTTVGLIKIIIRVLMESVPEGLNFVEIKEELEAIPGAVRVHDLHIWTLTMGRNCLSCHIASKDHVETLRMARKVCRKHGIRYTTIQIDPIGMPCHGGFSFQV